MNAITSFDMPKSVYVCFHLRSERASRACLERLSQRGVDCVSEGEAFEAYGVVDEEDQAEDWFNGDPEVVLVERKDPPSSK